jgi:hypothetical protein
MTEAMDMDGRLDQLVRAGLMPTSSLPLLKRAISRMHAGMSLQGAERDVMNMFISSMMFIVLGDDTVFNKARAGAKSYAAEEADSKQHIEVTHITGQKSKKPVHPDNAFKALNHYKSLSTTKSARIVSEAKEKTEYDYEGDMAMGQLKSIIANSQRMHDMLSDDTNLPEWVQSKITLAEDYISTASNYMQGEMNESKDDVPFDGPYRKVGDRKDKYGNPIKNVAKHLAKKAMNAQKNEEVQIDELSKDTYRSYANKASRDYLSGKIKDAKKDSNRGKYIDKAVGKVFKESEQIDELSKKTLGSYIKKASGAEKPKNVMDPKNIPLTKIAAYQGDSETGHFGKRFNQKTYDKAERLHKNRSQGITRAADKLTKEEVEQVDEISKATMGRYINKAKDSIDMTSYRSGIKDGTAISSSTPYKSNNPLEKKLSKRHKGIETAVKKLTKEESEQIDELSKATMGRYINKAATKMGSQGVTAGLKIAADEKSSKNFKDMGKREKGISRAVNKLTKEDIDAVKKMNESYKTAFETALNEYGIKSPSELDESKRKEFFNHVDLEFKKGDN